MARSVKKGINYYSLDVDIFSDRKIRRILNTHGAASMAVVLKILCAIYDEQGYYIAADDDFFFDVADELKVEETFVRAVVDKCIDVGLFDGGMLTGFGILTSARIQRNYIDATQRRTKNDMNECYLLVSAYENGVSVDNNAVSTYKNAVSVDKSTQRKEKEIKEEESIPNQGAGAYAYVSYGEYVSMAAEEYDKLVSQYGSVGAKQMVDMLDNYKGASGKQYDSDYRAILSWVVARWRQEQKGTGRVGCFERETENYDYLAVDVFADEDG